MQLKKTLTTLIIIAIIFVTSVIMGYLAPVQIMELKARDYMFELRGEQDVSHSDIVIIEMGQDADDEIPYKYPWPTYVYANLIENLNRAGVKAIAIDVIFDQYDMYDSRNDSLFAEAIRKYGNVVLATTFSRRVGYTRDGTEIDHSGFVNPNDVLRRGLTNPTGVVNAAPDEDGFLRNYIMHLTHRDETRYGLAVEMLRLLNGITDDQIYREGRHLNFGDYRIPLFRGNLMHINYYGPSRTFDYLGFEYIIDDKDFETVTEMEAFEMNLFDDPEIGILHQGILEDKIVFVGATMPELQDFHPVPMKRAGSNQMAGVETHAHALQTILDRNFLSLSGTGTHLLIVLFWSVLMVLGARKLSVWGGFFLAASGLFAWMAGSLYLFIEYQLMMMYISPGMAIVFGYSGVNAYQFFQEQREKTRIQGMFSSYVSPELVNQMVKSDDEFRLGGSEAELTAFFSDVANFSTLSEQLTASELIQLMNEYLEEMTAIVMEEDGTLDKYIGDALMAFYGAPVPVDNHAYKACVSAIRMQKALVGLRDGWQERDENLPEDILNLRIRIGINTGPMVVGNMGSSQRFNYTILGDHVNVAARCESACKKYGTNIMVTDDTMRRAEKEADRALLFRFLDNVRVKGRVEPVRVFELVGFLDEISDEIVDAVYRFNDAAELFLNQEWDLAESIFNEIEILEPKILGYKGFSESPSSLYLKRCKLLRANPPQNGWDGVFEQTAEL